MNNGKFKITPTILRRGNINRNSTKSRFNRRKFLGAGATGLAGAALSGSSPAHARIIGANDRINIGVVKIPPTVESEDELIEIFLQVF